MTDFDKYILTIEKRTVKISLPPDKEALEKAFWAGFRYCEDLNKSKETLEASIKSRDQFGIFDSIFGKSK